MFACGFFGLKSRRKELKQFILKMSTKRKSYAEINQRLIDRYYEWMVAQHFAKETKIYYIKILRLFCDFVGAQSMTDVTHLDVRRFIARSSEEGTSHDQVYKRLGILRVFYDFLKLGGVVSYVAPRFVRLRVPNWQVPPVFSQKEAERCIAAAETLRERALVEVFYGSGFRAVEARHLKIEDLNFSEKTARITGKYDKTRDVLLTDGAVQALRAYIGIRGRGFVFQPWWMDQHPSVSSVRSRWYGTWRDYRSPRRYKENCTYLGRVDSMPRAVATTKFEAELKKINRDGPVFDRPLSNPSICKAIREVGKRAGLKEVHPQMLRRAFATHLYNNGVRPEIIQTLMGHVFFGTTKTYIRISVDKVESEFRRNHPRGQMNVPQLPTEAPTAIR
jgi:integrase/recombinase XerC